MCLKWFCFISIATYTMYTVNVDAIWTWPRICWFQGDCCPETWVPGNSNVSGLINRLQDKVYGQHIVLKTVKRYIKAHMTDTDPSKAVLLAMHGGTGTGKSYITSIIAESIYQKGMKSKFVHFLSATIHFPHKNDLQKYKDFLRELMATSVKNCERSMFIFDEIDKMPPGLIDIVLPYLEYYDNQSSINYRKAIFIFLSNTAGREIQQQTLNVWYEGKERESIELKDMEKLIITSAVNTINTSLYHNDLLIQHVITAHIPFLPLERKHVRQCIKNYLLIKKYYKTYENIKDEKVREIEEELLYFPEEEQLFSANGCKRVPEKTIYVMDEDW